MLRVDWCLWPKCSYNSRREMEVLSESYFTYVFPEESAACSRWNCETNISDDGILGERFGESQSHYWRVLHDFLNFVNRRIKKYAMKIALHVIAAAGYGYRFEWESSAVIPPGHRLSFRDSICITLDNLITLAVVPSWLRKFPSSTCVRRS